MKNKLNILEQAIEIMDDNILKRKIKLEEKERKRKEKEKKESEQSQNIPYNGKKYIKTTPSNNSNVKKKYK